MTNCILVYGIISGLIISVLNTLSHWLGIGHVWLGYLVMLITFSAIFVAIKQFRDEISGGVTTFGIAFRVGLGITMVASLAYVIVWEVYAALTDFSYIDVDTYAQSIIDARQVDDAAGLAAAREDSEALREKYANPFFRLPMAFLEIFPVGALVSLISALILKNSAVFPAR